MNRKRPKQIVIRVSEKELQQIKENVKLSGKSQQDYIISALINQKVVNTDGINKLLPEIKRIGNNLNQIAHRCNEGGMLPSEKEVRKHGEELNNTWRLLKQYLRNLE